MPLLNLGCRVIDLSADFRHVAPTSTKEFYAHDHPAPGTTGQGGLRFCRKFIVSRSRTTCSIASPGCYPTSIPLPVIPLLLAKLIKPHGIIADSMSGVSGSGRKAELDYLFCECNESVRLWRAEHRHLSEIEEQLGFAANTKVTVHSRRT